MDEKSLEILEFPQIREILAEFTSFSASRELALTLKPRRDYETISQLLGQSAEARHLLSLDPDISIGSIIDIRENVKLAALGRVLEPQDLLEIQQTLTAVRQLRHNLRESADEAPLLWNIAHDLVELRQLEKEILKCLGPNGEVLDTASPALASVRHQLREIRGQLLQRLEGIINSPRGQRVLQETIITEREGRYVIPVKLECRNDIKGIVHDISNTGATIFIEPAVTVDMGNAHRELVIEERREIERLLGILSAQVGLQQSEISRSIVQAAELDLAFAKARYARKIGATEPAISQFSRTNRKTEDDGTGTLRLIEARHPLLTGKAVPLSIEMGRDFSILVITGPNTGGKTVALKTIGLLSMMAQAGLPIPAAAESHLPVFDGIFADIGDEQSIQQTLSSFSWHIGNMVRIIRHATKASLVLLDELGTSTDPAEGSALARAILSHFRSRGTMTVTTTHYTDLKAFAHLTPGIQNASLDFDPDTLMPTYHLTVGIPGGSNALATASRLGLSPDIITHAREMLSKGTEELEALLEILMAEKKQVSAIHHDLTKARNEVAKQEAELANQRQRFQAEEQNIIQETRDRIVREAAELHREIRHAAAELRREKSKERIEQAKKTVAEVQRQLDREAWIPKTPEAHGEAADERTIKIGDTVWLKEADLRATVLAISKATQQIEVQVGQARLTLGLDGVKKLIPQHDKSTATLIPVSQPAGRTASLELDLRGKRADEIELLVDSYLNDAALANLDTVRIIHGFGTGTVRSIVRDFIVSHPLVSSFRPGERNEGGDGVTMINL